MYSIFIELETDVVYPFVEKLVLFVYNFLRVHVWTPMWRYFCVRLGFDEDSTVMSILVQTRMLESFITAVLLVAYGINFNRMLAIVFTLHVFVHMLNK